MCPFCLSTLGLVIAGTISTGGLAALAVKVTRNTNHPGKIQQPNERNDENGNAEK